MQAMTNAVALMEESFLWYPRQAGVRGSGSLWFIASGSGRVHGVFRYRPAGAPSAKDYRIAPYDEAGRMGLNLVAMREKAARIEPGVPGDCDLCGEWSARLIRGACAPCRDRYKLP